MKAVTAIASVSSHVDGVWCFVVPFVVDGSDKRLMGPHPAWPTEQESPEQLVAQLMQGDCLLGVMPQPLGAMVYDLDPRGSKLEQVEQASIVREQVPVAMSRRSPSGGTHHWSKLTPGTTPKPLEPMPGMHVDYKTSGYVLWHQSGRMWSELARLPEALEEVAPCGEDRQVSKGQGGFIEGKQVHQLIEALSTVKDDLSYDEWVMVGMALHSIDSSPEMMARWHRSTARHLGDNEAAVQGRWKSFKQGGGVGIGTLIKILEQHGYPLQRLRSEWALGLLK